MKDHATGVAALDNATADAYASDRVIMIGVGRTPKDPAKLSLIDEFFSYEPYGLMLRRGDAPFRLIDVLVFTAGIGEHAAPVRARVCENAAWLGIHLDPAANLRGGPRISTPDSSVSVWVIATNEELMIAKHTLACIRR